MVATRIDSRLARMCEKNNWVYSRYADDLAISGGTGIKKARNTIEKIIMDEGFFIKKAKIEMILPKEGKILVGLRIVKNQVLLPRSYYKNLRSMIFKFNKGIEGAKPKETNLEYPSNLSLHMLCTLKNSLVQMANIRDYPLQSL